MLGPWRLFWLGQGRAGPMVTEGKMIVALVLPWRAREPAGREREREREKERGRVRKLFIHLMLSFHLAFLKPGLFPVCILFGWH